MTQNAADTRSDDAQDTVILLHGIGRTSRSMAFMARALAKNGFAPLGITYPSRRHGIPTLSDYLEKRLDDEGAWQPPGKVHFVTHSMGGLLVRHFLETRKVRLPVDSIGRVVMLGPPNGGSEVADQLHKLPPYKWFYGPAGQELTTDARSRNQALPYYEIGVIAGSRGWPYFVANHMVPAPHDGRVSVAKTKLIGMKDHIALPATHSFIAWNPSVHRQTCHFLKTGQFTRS